MRLLFCGVHIVHGVVLAVSDKRSYKADYKGTLAKTKIVLLLLFVYTTPVISPPMAQLPFDDKTTPICIYSGNYIQIVLALVEYYGIF